MKIDDDLTIKSRTGENYYVKQYNTNLNGGKVTFSFIKLKDSTVLVL